VNIYTKWFWTVDLHNLMHFLRLRLDGHAQHEIKVYADAILDLIDPIVPATMAVFKETL
jgi:thymidylate synthase (FAD)